MEQLSSISEQDRSGGFVVVYANSSGGQRGAEGQFCACIGEIHFSGVKQSTVVRNALQPDKMELKRPLARIVSHPTLT